MKVKPGTRLRSQVDGTEIIVVRSPAGDLDVACGGQPMIDVAAEPGPGLAGAGDHAEGTQLGKRYTLGGDAAVELLVTKPGKYGLSIDGTPLVLKEAKPLPSSD
ncbi:MAG: hypothetical protein QOG28_2728 [Trebonia sp.]|nr:hypothetical protein [Actinomycetes bacterium]MDX6418108.1 hypothetical protein [Trebonia sp.]